MQKDDLYRAVAEAKRFLDRVNDYREATKNPDGEYEYDGVIHKIYPSAPAESGAMRRASLALTRALAAMRRP